MTAWFSTLRVDQLVCGEAMIAGDIFFPAENKLNNKTCFGAIIQAFVEEASDLTQPSLKSYQ